MTKKHRCVCWGFDELPAARRPPRPYTKIEHPNVVASSWPVTPARVQKLGRAVSERLFHAGLHCLDPRLDLGLDGFEIEACAALHRWKSMNVCAYSATFCCRKTKRQNSWMKKSPMYSNEPQAMSEPDFARPSARTAAGADRASRRRLGVAIAADHPPAWHRWRDRRRLGQDCAADEGKALTWPRFCRRRV